MTGLTAIARLIATCDDLPDWLVPTLRTACDALAWIVSAEKRAPGREALRERLRTLEAAAELVRVNLRDIDISTMLLDGDPYFLNQNEMYEGLCDVERRTRRLINDIPVGPGRGKYFGPSEGLNPRVSCALMISVIWDRAHGKSPPNANKLAQSACDALWEEAGGDTSAKIGTLGGGKSVSVWRDHLRAAKVAKDSTEARHVKGLLTSK